MNESEKWKWSRSVVSDSATPWTAAHQAPRSMGFSRQEYWSACHCLLQGEGIGYPLLYSCLGFHGQKSLVNCSPRGPKELDKTQWLSTAMWRKSERLISSEECSFYKKVKFVIEASFKWQRMWYEKKGDEEMSKLSLWNNLWAGIFPKDNNYVHISIMSD